MIVDTSAIVAILKKEDEAEHFKRLISRAVTLRLSAANYLEVAIVVDKARNPELSRSLDELLDRAGIAIEPVTGRQARLAREAYRDFGKGSGHPARLNFGDCFAYALAADLREPLLYKGEDFTATGVRCAGE